MGPSTQEYRAEHRQHPHTLWIRHVIQPSRQENGRTCGRDTFPGATDTYRAETGTRVWGFRLRSRRVTQPRNEHKTAPPVAPLRFEGHEKSTPFSPSKCTAILAERFQLHTALVSGTGNVLRLLWSVSNPRARMEPIKRRRKTDFC